ncbi:hypothetical protein LTR40_006223 [Exophiala xenobiotica]|nr:hypothetical protein LTR40_006223 [Exophiala xenobiotica]
MVEEHPIPRKLWVHPDPKSTEMYKFKTRLQKKLGRTFESYDDMYDWSCSNRSDFWKFVLEYFPVVYSGTVPDKVVDESARMDSIPRWFAGVKMNFAQNILFSGDVNGKPVIDAAKADDKVACTQVREGSFIEPIRYFTWKELRQRVGRLSQAMKARGVSKGDRIAIVASTSIDTLTVFLATTTLGALFSSSSTDMGVKGILDRLTQIKPKYLFMDDWAVYNGKRVDLRSKMKDIMAGMGGVTEFQGIALLMGCRMLMYDGSPFVPNITNFVKLVGQEKVTHLGISPRFLQTLQANKIVPKQVTDLSNLKVVTSTGMVLSEQLFEWFYDQGFPASAQLDNISGGTDLVGCFGCGNPILPVYSGGCQSRSLGIPVKVCDQTIEGGAAVEVEDGVPGELVAYAAFPTMPLTFLGTDGPKRYFDSYFARFDNVWTHGDFIMIHPVTKQVMFLGRSDGVLNPSGVRFGSAEIYNILESKFADKISDSICVGQRRPTDTDERVVLFLLMKPGHEFTPKLIREVKEAIRKETSPRHVPKFVFETKDIPTTVNLKKVELPVKQIVSGKVIKPSGTLANPESLEYYYRFAKDENLVDLADSKAKL